MKKTISFALLLMLAFTSAFAKDHMTVRNGSVTVSYGQSAKNGKQIFAAKPNDGALIPFGKYWRPGDDKGTEITFDKDCMFAGFPVKAGTYTLLLQSLNRGEWMVALNSKLGQKGTFNYDKVKADNVLRSYIGAKQMDKVVENFTITLQEDGLLMQWDDMSAFASIK
jgi:hypothetical protein